MNKSIVIQIRRDDDVFFTDLRSSNPEALRIIETKGLEGADYINGLISLSFFTLPLVTKLLVELIRARKFVSVKVDGIELTGLSESNAKELLEQLLKDPDE